MSDISQDLKPLITKIGDGIALNEQESEQAFHIIMSGEASAAQIGAFLMGLKVRGETVSEITGAVRVMRAKALTVAAPAGAMDIVGTGGDGHGTYNISTATAFVVAGTGVPVAKHGNKAVSSKAGTADALSALGVNLDTDMANVERAIAEAGIGFLMAPRHHSAMRHVGPIRAELGMRTIFNILGPLSNPAGVKRLLVGTYAKDLAQPMAQTLLNLGAEAAWVVHGADGLDELSTTGPNLVARIANGTIETVTVTAADAGLFEASLGDLIGGTPEYNAAAIRALLAGEEGPYRDIVLFNAAAALCVSGTVGDLKAGVALAAASIDNGKAQAALDTMVSICEPPEGNPA